MTRSPLPLACIAAAAALAAPPLSAQPEGAGDAPPVAVLSFTVSGLAPGAVMGAALDLAASEHLARLRTPPEGSDEQLRGALVFRGIEAARAWIEGEMADWRAPVGEAEIDMGLELYREDLLRMSDVETVLAGLEELDIEYTNTGNDAEGDSDIDAVTVVCTGDDPDCEPSN